MQYGMNVGDLALSNLFNATDDDQSIDPEAIQARGRAVCVEEQLTEADCTRLMGRWQGFRPRVHTGTAMIGG